MPIDVVPYSAQWPAAFDRVAGVLRTALADVPTASVEHVGHRARGVRGAGRRPPASRVRLPGGHPQRAHPPVVRDVLRSRDDLRDEYAAVKLAMAADPAMDIDTYIARKSGVLQKVLAESDLTDEERRQIWRLNDPSVQP